MISNKHLAIVRAALTFWHEEMGGAIKPEYQHYLHSNDRSVEFDDSDVMLVRQFLNQSELRYTSYDSQTGELSSLTSNPNDIDSPNAAVLTPLPSQPA